MAKSKRGRALFDLLDNDGEEIAELLSQERRTTRSGSRRVKAQAQRSEASATKALRLAEPVESEEQQVRWFRLDGHRVRLSLTSVAAALVLFGALLCLVMVFKIGDRRGFADGLAQGYEKGRASFTAETMSEIDLARSQAPATQLVEDLYALPAAAEVAQNLEAPPSDKPEWIEGFTYIVAQEFPARDAANVPKAQGFLAEHGIPTAQVRYPSGSVQLITTQGFNRKDATQKRMADQLLKKLHVVGRQYFKSGGGYKLAGYFKKLTGHTW